MCWRLADAEIVELEDFRRGTAYYAKIGSCFCQGDSSEATAATLYRSRAGKTAHPTLPEGSSASVKGHSLATAYSNCPRCGRKMILTAPPDGNLTATMQCLTRDRPDLLKSETVEGWIRSSLRPPA